MKLTNNRQAIIIATGCGIAILLIVFGIFLTRNTATPTKPPQAYIGNSSGTPDAGKQTAAAFVGYDNLIQNGVTYDQVNALQTAFRKYQPLSAPTTVIDIGGSNLIPYAPDQSDPLYRPSIGASVVVNQKTTYKIKFYYWGTSTIELLIYDATGATQLFDSGTVTGSS